MDTDNSIGVTKEKGIWFVVKDKVDQIYGEGRRLDFGWQAHNTLYT